MHILFAHKNFPAQFGQIARRLVIDYGFRCTLASEVSEGRVDVVDTVRYAAKGGARAETHYCTRTFENQMWRTSALFDTLAARPDIRPDLVVGHSGFVSTLFLRELYDCPFVSYLEFFYHTRGGDIDFRTDLPPLPTIDVQRARARNAMLLLDLHYCDAGYSPTQWQRQQLPVEYQPKIETIFDGIDTSLWRRDESAPRRVGGLEIPQGTRIVSHVSRGMESYRGFDIFMRLAKRLCDRRDDVVFLIAGEPDRMAYSGDERFTGGKSFKDWVLAQDQYDLERIRFLGLVKPQELATLFSISDLHVYLTVPFVLSWSVFNALACGATVLVSDTGPVHELIEHEVNGLRAGFFDVDRFETLANAVLDDPGAYRELGRAGIRTIEERYSMEVCLPRLHALFERTAAAG